MTDVQFHYPLFFVCLFTKQKVEEKHNTKRKSIDVSGMASPLKIWIDKRAKTVKKYFLSLLDWPKPQKSAKVSPMALCSSSLWTILYKADGSFPDPGKKTDRSIWNSSPVVTLKPHLNLHTGLGSWKEQLKCPHFPKSLTLLKECRFWCLVHGKNTNAQTHLIIYSTKFPLLCFSYRVAARWWNICNHAASLMSKLDGNKRNL